MIIENWVARRMFPLVTILDWYVDSEETTKFTQGAQKEAIAVAAQETGLMLNDVVGHLHTFSV